MFFSGITLSYIFAECSLKSLRDYWISDFSGFYLCSSITFFYDNFFQNLKNKLISERSLNFKLGFWKKITINWVSRWQPNYFFFSTVIHANFFPFFLNGLWWSYRFRQAPVSHARPVCRSELLVVDYFGLLLMLYLNQHALQKEIVNHYGSCSQLFIGDWSLCILPMQWWKVSEWAHALTEKMYPLMKHSVLLSVAQWFLCSGCFSRSWPQRACRVCYAFSNGPLFAKLGKLNGVLNCLIFRTPLISHCNFPRWFEPFDSFPLPNFCQWIQHLTVFVNFKKVG